jgi:hypothetical protein
MDRLDSSEIANGAGAPFAHSTDRAHRLPFTHGSLKASSESICRRKPKEILF